MDYDKIDFAEIEAKARQMRAEAMADLIAGAKSAIATLWANITIPSNLGSRKVA